MWSRFLGDTLVSFALAAVLALAGLFAAPPLARAVCAFAGIERLAFTGPNDLAWFALGIAFAFALPALLSWVLGFVARLATSAPPTATQLVVDLVVPVLAAVLGAVKQAWWMRLAMESLALGPDAIEPMITVTSLDLAPTAITWTVAAAAVVAAGTIARARLDAGKTKSPPPL